MNPSSQSAERHLRLKPLEQIDRIADSSALRGSEALCRLLKYVARHSLELPDASLKEHQIAIEVFGRPPGFDPRLDSTVRVQMSRLRAKLIDYYADEGRDDLILVDIPKGRHRVVFTDRPSPGGPEPHPSPARSGRGRLPNRWILGSALALLAIVALWLGQPFVRPRPVPFPSPSRDPVALYWQGFLKAGADPPLVVFSNAEFIGRPETGLRYYRPGQDPSSAVFDHYTGVGEAIAIHELDQLFAALGHPSQLKRGRLLNWDDTKDRDVIFLGSPSENLSLRESSLAREFRFQITDQAPRKGDLVIANLHPSPGEQPVYFASQGLPITEDYAVVELARGTASAHSILMLAGITTFGTQGAVEFVSCADCVRDLLPRVRDGAVSVAPFAALLHIRISRGVPTESRLIALRRTGR